MIKTLPRIGIIGSGRLGTAVARQALSAGYEVSIANAHGPGSLNLITKVLLPGAIAATVEATVLNNDIVVLAMPMSQYHTLPAKAFENKIVIDAMNYWEPTEGHITELTEATTTSELVQSYLQGVRVVKSLNHVAYNELNEHALPIKHMERRAIAMAGDNLAAKTAVASFIETLGFDAVDFGALRQGGQFQPDTQLFNARLTRNAMLALKA